MKKLAIVLILLIAFFLGAILLPEYIENKRLGIEFSNDPNKITTTTQVDTGAISYKGKTDKDALTLLKEQAPVEQDSSGLVVSINGRKADSAKREYWAFYVNGELAPVGPAEYETKDGDRIEWRISNY